MASRFDPRSGIADFVAYVREPRPHRWTIWGLSAALPAAVFGMFLIQFKPREKEYVPPEVNYVTQWDSSRSRQEITAQQARDLPRERAERAALLAAEEERKQQFRRVADMMGLDVDQK